MQTPIENVRHEFYKIQKSKPLTLVCFSHLRWDFVYQRPQHLISRFSNICDVYFIEEPVYEDVKEAILSITRKDDKLWIVKPHLPHGLNAGEQEQTQKKLFQNFFTGKNLRDFIFWYYTPMALAFTADFKPSVTVYDCMDELANFKFAPERLVFLEEELIKRVDVVFTGGQSLYEHKKNSHKNIHPFPSSIDKQHFLGARSITEEPLDQKSIKGPKLGFFGVIDERFDIELVKGIAASRPDWSVVLLGPVVKISEDSLPKLPNVHWLGSKCYNQLPNYLSGWDAALIPFELNEATKFISPTKTPEYLAAGVPVISTPIQDVINPYGKSGLVKIASSAAEFVANAEVYFEMDKDEWLQDVDAFLADKSWDNTFNEMLGKILAVYERKFETINLEALKKNDFDFRKSDQKFNQISRDSKYVNGVASA